MSIKGALYDLKHWYQEKQEQREKQLREVRSEKAVKEQDDFNLLKNTTGGYYNPYAKTGKKRMTFGEFEQYKKKRDYLIKQVKYNGKIYDYYNPFDYSLKYLHYYTIYYHTGGTEYIEVHESQYKKDEEEKLTEKQNFYKEMGWFYD